MLRFSEEKFPPWPQHHVVLGIARVAQEPWALGHVEVSNFMTSRDLSYRTMQDFLSWICGKIGHFPPHPNLPDVSQSAVINEQVSGTQLKLASLQDDITASGGRCQVFLWARTHTHTHTWSVQPACEPLKVGVWTGVCVCVYSALCYCWCDDIIFSFLFELVPYE